MQALVQYMTVSGLTQTALAKRIGINQGQLNRWLSGDRIPNAKNLKLISEKTGIRLDRLMEDL